MLYFTQLLNYFYLRKEIEMKRGRSIPL